MIPLYWHVSQNFGDCLSPWLVRKLSGESVAYSDPTKQASLVAIGSLIGAPLQLGVVWGAGLAADNLTPLSVKAVRGPLTRAVLLRQGVSCPEVYGDPAMLLRELCPDPVRPLFKVGLIPHIADFSALTVPPREGSLVIDVRWPVEEVILRIRQCKTTVSSSLHGLIVSHAFGIPCAPVRFGDRVIGGSFKFRDYLLGAGLADCGELPLVSGAEWSEIDGAPQIGAPLTFNTAGLRAAFTEALSLLV